MSLENIVANLVQKVENRFYGKYRGLVVDNADPEQLGRLKLQVPSILGNEVVTGWAMPCVPYGGDKDQGFLFIPEVGAGVWVEFEEGDLEFPIWVGTFWSKPGGESEIPKVNDEAQAAPTRKMIKTKKGHTIQLEDADGKETIVISHTDGARIEMDAKGSILINNNAEQPSFIYLNSEDQETTVADKHQNLITMKSAGVLVAHKGSNYLEIKDGVAQISAKAVVIFSSSISLGAPPSLMNRATKPYSVLLGEKFALAFDTHVHAHPLGPTLPPTIPLFGILKTVSSQAVKIYEL